MKLINNIKLKNAKIAIIGLGYVGLPLLINFLTKKFIVIGLDSNKSKISNLKKGKTNVLKFSKAFKKIYKSKNLILTSNYEIIKDVDIIIICLPTPIKSNKTPDLDDIKNCLLNLKKYIKKEQLISLESTTYPGTTRELLCNMVLKKKFQLGKNFYVVYSPEREDPTMKKFSVGNIPKLVSGSTKNCLKLGNYLYQQITKTVPVSSLETAEFTKILENVYRSINIGFINEMKIVSKKLNVDIYEAINAAKTKPFGFMPFYPGPGLGGHCIPVDPYLLSWKAKKIGAKTDFIKLSAKINEQMPAYVVNNLIKSFSSEGHKLKDKKILILGVTYKKNIDDIRESPSLKIIEILERKKAIVDYTDPFYKGKLKSPTKKNRNIKNIKLGYEKLIKYHAVILVTDHDCFNYKQIKKYSKKIIDTRNRYLAASNKIIKS